jgi:hypothetical protein
MAPSDFNRNLAFHTSSGREVQYGTPPERLEQGGPQPRSAHLEGNLIVLPACYVLKPGLPQGAIHEKAPGDRMPGALPPDPCPVTPHAQKRLKPSPSNLAIVTAVAIDNGRACL